MSAREYYQKSLRSMSHLNIYLMWSFDPLYLINSAYNESIPSEKTHMTKIRACGLPFNSQGLPSCSVWSTMFNVHLIIAHSTLVGDFFKSTLSALLSLSLNISLLIFAEIPGLISASDKSWSAVITKGKDLSLTLNCEFYLATSHVLRLFWWWDSLQCMMQIPFCPKQHCNHPERSWTSIHASGLHFISSQSLWLLPQKDGQHHKRTCGI